MTPQSNFMVIAPIMPEREKALRELLAGMNLRPGVVNPVNSVVPFATFDRLHVARLVILRDETLADLAAYGESFPDAPLWLAFLGDCDGPPEEMVEELALRGGAGLRSIFAHCAGFAGNSDLAGWLRDHQVTPAAQYVNWVGRTVRDIQQEAALHAALLAYLSDAGAGAVSSPETTRRRLLDQVRTKGPILSPPAPTPAQWRMRHLLDLVGYPLLLLLASPLLLLIAPFFLWQLRRKERTDPVIAPRPGVAQVRALSTIEDHDVSNQFSALGSVKPGRFRLWTLLFLFRLLDYSTRHIYTRGRLARVGTIHFARWVFLDSHRRLFFASNYDGSLDSYMDDFINKVAFGLNLVFSNGVGYPRTRFLIMGGASNEQEFKNYLRRHQIPTQVWYKAYPDLTAADLARNTMIREGLERPMMTDVEARQWLAMI
jgi:hypothetical protein